MLRVRLGRTWIRADFERARTNSVSSLGRMEAADPAAVIRLHATRIPSLTQCGKSSGPGGRSWNPIGPERGGNDLRQLRAEGE